MFGFDINIREIEVASPDAFLRSLESPWMQRALIAAVIVGLICGIIGVFILLRGMVFLGEAIAHSAFAGAALALLLGVNPIWPMLLFGITAAISVGYVNEKKIMREEVVIGVFFSFFMALAILFIGLMPFYSTDVTAILFGNILLISVENFWILVLLAICVFTVLWMIKKELYFITFNEELAGISGVPVRILNYAFLILVAVTIDISLKSIGAVLVFAMVVTPAAAAYQWTFRLNRLIFLSSFFGILSMTFGLFLSYMLDLPSGSTSVMVVTLIFAVSFLLSPKRRFGSFTIDECLFCRDAFPSESECANPECFVSEIPHVHDADRLWIKKESLEADKQEKLSQASREEPLW
ncbi:MAG: metal ABC transporter permease [Candidatus Thorarchaeota archaeon]